MKKLSTNKPSTNKLLTNELQFTPPATPIKEHSVTFNNWSQFSNINSKSVTESQTAKIASYATNSTDTIVAGIFGYFAVDIFIIEGLWVNKTLRNQGVASRLLHLFESHARKHGAIEIQVHTHSQAVHTFYCGKGYINVDLKNNWQDTNAESSHNCPVFCLKKPL